MNHRINISLTLRKNGDSWFFLIAAMLAVFCVLKVLRGGDISNNREGGLWNYISLLYYPVFLCVIVSKIRFRIQMIFVAALMFVGAILFSTIVTFELELSVSFAYQLLMLPYSMLVLFTFYLCATEGDGGKRMIYGGYLVCLALTLYFMFRFRFGDRGEAVRSDIYFSLGLFPFVMQFERKMPVRRILMVAQFVAVFLSNKRTAFISFVLGLVLYLLIETWVTNSRKFGRMVKAMITVAVVGLLFYSISRYIDNVFNFRIYDRLFSLEDDEGSGRLIIYRRVWEHFQSSTMMEKVFGHGMNSVGKIAGAGHAHNDLLEVLYNNGIFACGWMGIFYMLVIREVIRMVKRKSPYAAAFAFSTVTGLFLAMFSYFVIFYTYVTCYVAFWGYALAMESKRLYQMRRDPV